MTTLKVRKGRRGAGGFTLVDVVFALALIAVAILGIISLMLVLKARNEAHSLTRHATRACQEVMEHILADFKSGHADPAGKWNGKEFQPRKVVALDKDVPTYQAALTDDTSDGHHKYNCGRTFVTDVSDPLFPGTLYEISVSIDTTGLTIPPIQTRLVTRRSTFK